MTLAIIGGTGFDQLVSMENTQTHNINTIWGTPSDYIYEGLLGSKKILFLRRHGGGEKRYPPHKINYRANIAALKILGATSVIGTAAVGGIGIDVGRILIPDQIIDYTHSRESTFFDGGLGPLEHIDFTQPYDGELRRKIIAAASSKSIKVITAGTYGVTQGPRLETAAEIERLARDGCNIVGMTGMPEAALAKEKGMPYATISVIVNPAAGLTNKELLLSDMLSVLSEAGTTCSNILKAIEN